MYCATKNWEGLMQKFKGNGSIFHCTNVLSTFESILEERVAFPNVLVGSVDVLIDNRIERSLQIFHPVKERSQLFILEPPDASHLIDNKLAI